MRLKELRKQYGYTQAEVAQKLNVTQQTYGRYELGKIEPPVSTLLKLSEIYNIPVDVLLGKISNTSSDTDKEFVDFLYGCFLTIEDISKITPEDKELLKESIHAFHEKYDGTIDNFYLSSILEYIANYCNISASELEKDWGIRLLNNIEVQLVLHKMSQKLAEEHIAINKPNTDKQFSADWCRNQLYSFKMSEFHDKSHVDIAHDQVVPNLNLAQILCADLTQDEQISVIEYIFYLKGKRETPAKIQV